MTVGMENQLTRIADALEALVKILQRAENPPEKLAEPETVCKPRWEKSFSEPSF